MEVGPGMDGNLTSVAEGAVAAVEPAAAPVEGEPLLVLRPETGWAALDLREVWQYRDLLFTLAGRDIKVRYKQTSLGIAWVILQPLVAAGILSFVFGKIAKMPSDGL